MPTLSIQLDDAALQAATAQAMAAAIPQEIQQQLIEKAIKDLLRPASGHMSSKSKIEEVFDNAIYKIAREKALEMVEKDPEVKKSLALLLENAFKHMLSPYDNDKMKKLAERLGDSFINSLRRD